MKNFTQPSIDRLDEFYEFIDEVMESFDWYFIKIYWHARHEFQSRLRTKNTDLFIRQKIEKSRMDPFLDHHDQLITIDNESIKVLKPNNQASLSYLLCFLETRIAAIGVLCVIFSEQNGKSAYFPQWAKISIQAARQTQLFRKKWNFFKAAFHENALFTSFYIKKEPGFFSLIAQENEQTQTLFFKGCSGQITLENTKGNISLMIEDCPRFTLELKNCRLKKVTIKTSLDALILNNSNLDKITIQATVGRLEATCQSQLRDITIQKSTIADIVSKNSKIQLSLEGQSIIHRLTGDSQSLVFITALESQLLFLKSEGFLQGYFENVNLKKLNLSQCNCAYLRFNEKTIVETLENPQSGSYQEIQKNDHMWAYYTSSDLDPPTSTLLKLNLLETKSPQIISMCELLDPLLIDESLKKILPHNDPLGEYEHEKSRIISKEILKWGICLLAQKIDPRKTYWYNFCCYYSSIHRLGIASPELDYKLLIKAFFNQYEEQLTQGRVVEPKSIQIELFSLLATDSVIKQSVMQPHLKAYYEDDKRRIICFIRVANTLKNYKTSSSHDIKNRLINQLLISFQVIFKDENLNITEKLIFTKQRLEDFQTLWGYQVKKDKILQLNVKICLKMIEDQIQSDDLTQKFSEEINQHLLSKKCAAIQEIGFLFKKSLNKYTTRDALCQVLSKIDSLCSKSDNLSVKKMSSFIHESDNFKRFKLVESQDEKIKKSLNLCKLILDTYQPVFSFFGPGKTKIHCFRYLSQFISNPGQKNIRDRFFSLKKMIAYLMQVVQETNSESRVLVLMQCAPLWNSKSRQARGYRSLLTQINEIMDHYNDPEINMNHLLQEEMARPMLKHSQFQFFNTHKYQTMRRKTCFNTD